MEIDYIINFIHQTSFDDLPKEAVTVIKNSFIDTISSTIAAESDPLSEKVRNVNSAFFNQEYASDSLLQTAFQGNPISFCFTFGTMSHILDFDDVNFTFHGHPSVALIPVILGLAKELKSSGKEMLESYAIGFEVQARIGEAMGTDQYQAGWHVTSTIGIYGAVAAASKLLGLNKLQIQHAFGIASSLAGGTRKNFGTMMKPLHTGFAAMHAYQAVKLAQEGVTATENIFNHPLSIDTITSGKEVNFSTFKKLGDEWELINGGIIFKKYPCCAFTHRSIDAVIFLTKENDLKIEDLEKIDTAVHYKVPTVLIYPKPTSDLQGKFSMNYCLAAAFLDRQINLDTFDDEKIQSERVVQLMDKVSMHVASEQVEGTDAQEQFSEVTITTQRGIFTKRIDFPKGHPKNPMNNEEFMKKFESCMSGRLTPSQAKSLYTILNCLEEYQYMDLEEIFLSEETS